MMVVCTSCGKLYGADKSCGGHFTHIKGCMEIRCCSGGHLEPYSIFREPSGLPVEAPRLHSADPVEKYFGKDDCPLEAGLYGSNDAGYANHAIREAAKFLMNACGSWRHGWRAGNDRRPFPEDHPLAVVMRILARIDQATARGANTTPDPTLFNPDGGLVLPHVEESKLPSPEGSSTLKENKPKEYISWAIWCDKDKDYHTLDGAIRLFSHKEEATRYRHCQRDEPTCDRVVEVEIQPK